MSALGRGGHRPRQPCPPPRSPSLLSSRPQHRPWLWSDPQLRPAKLAARVVEVLGVGVGGSGGGGRAMTLCCPLRRAGEEARPAADPVPVSSAWPRSGAGTPPSPPPNPPLLPDPPLLPPPRHLEERQSMLSDRMSVGEFLALLLPSHQPGGAGGGGCRQGRGTLVPGDLGVWGSWTPPALCLGGQMQPSIPGKGQAGRGCSRLGGRMPWGCCKSPPRPVGCLNPCLHPLPCPRLRNLC